MSIIGKRFFKKDSRWHFFHEGDYCLIRTSKKSKDLERYLHAKEIRFTIGIWEDPHETVRKYQHLFEPMFHSFTILGLYGEDREFRAAFNRVSHCFTNMCGLDSYSECVSLANRMIEQIFLATQGAAKAIAKEAVENYKKEIRK